MRSKRPKPRKMLVTREERFVSRRPNDAWCMDFVADQVTNGERFGALTIVDGFSREALAIQVGQSPRGEHGVDVCNHLVAQRRAPKRVFVDDDGDGLVDFGADPGCTSASDASEANGLLCEIAMSQASYVDGEAVMIASLRFANPETVTVPARLRLEFPLPSGVTANALDLGADGSFALPASSENQRGPVTMFAAGPEIPRCAAPSNGAARWKNPPPAR